MKVLTKGDELREFYGSALVPTMGALHEGHASLMRAAAATGHPVLVSIFVNPKQFAAGEDLDRYPRTLEADLELCRSLGVSAVFAPDANEIYPPGQKIKEISPGDLGSELEGAVRPTHFQGVLTVVHRLFQLAKPSVAVFGKKDRQQLVLIKSMVDQLRMSIQIIEGQTVRDSDGLALSSRNRFLAAEERRYALRLPRALSAGVAQADRGVIHVLAAAHQELMGLDVDYCEVRDRDLDLVDDDFQGPAILLGAIRVGGVRLIDNMDLVIS